jgi:hypothetical protein
MDGHLWFDIFAYIGMAAIACALLLSVYIVGVEARIRRRENRELREFNRQMAAISSIWERNPDV